MIQEYTQMHAGMPVFVHAFWCAPATLLLSQPVEESVEQSTGSSRDISSAGEGKRPPTLAGKEPRGQQVAQ
jgi:hypothetical protein